MEKKTLLTVFPFGMCLTLKRLIAVYITTKPGEALSNDTRKNITQLIFFFHSTFLSISLCLFLLSTEKTIPPEISIYNSTLSELNKRKSILPN